MIKTKVAFLEGRLLCSQSEQSEKFSTDTQFVSHKCIYDVIYDSLRGFQMHIHCKFANG